jgi:hypothetical protein
VRAASFPLAFSLALPLTAACSDHAPPEAPGVYVDPLLTVAVQIGGDPLVTGRVSLCPGTPPAVAYADGAEVARVDAVTFFTRTPADGEAPEPGLLFQMSLAAEALAPNVYGLPATFDLELEIRCGDAWVRSPPFAMIYLPTLASMVPPFRSARFWPASSAVGDFLVCEDTALVLYQGGVTPIRTMEVGFACAVSDLSEGAGDRRYLRGESVGIAAIDGDDTLAWSRPSLIVETKVDATRDPVVLREEFGVTVLAVLDRATGADRVGPIDLTRVPLGPLARTESGDILVLESERTAAPDGLTYYVQRLSPDGADLGSIVVATYMWRAPSYVAEFTIAGDALFVAAAPDGDLARWIEKIDTTAGSLLWATAPTDPWRYPLGDAYGRALVASDSGFAWLDLTTGAPASQAFAPDSGNSFLRAYVETDGSLVMLADDTGGIAQGLYLFAPNGAATVRFRPGAALFRWLAPGWGTGTVVSFFNEVHWLYAREEYDALLAP